MSNRWQQEPQESYGSIRIHAEEIRNYEISDWLFIYRFGDFIAIVCAIVS